MLKLLAAVPGVTIFDLHLHRVGRLQPRQQFFFQLCSSEYGDSTTFHSMSHDQVRLQDMLSRCGATSFLVVGEVQLCT